MADHPKSKTSGRRRPPAEIELTATEATADPVAAAQSAEVAAEPNATAAVSDPAAQPTISAIEPSVPPAESPAPEARSAVEDQPRAGGSPEWTPAEPPRDARGGVLVKAVIAGAVAGAAFGALAALFLPVLRGRPRTIDLAPLETRLSALEKRDTGADAARLQALGDQIAELQKQLAGQREALSAVKQTATTGVSNEIAPLAARVQGLEQSGQALASKVSGVASGQTTSLAASLLAATQSLRSAFERGAPLQPELKAVEAISGKGDRLSALRPYATAGAPTVRTLAERFRALRPGLVNADAAPASSGILDRLAASASSIVKVTPVGAQPGSDTASVLSRIDAALQRGDADLALSEAAGLPEKPAQAASAWLGELKARQAAAAVLRGLENDALQVISAASR